MDLTVLSDIDRLRAIAAAGKTKLSANIPKEVLPIYVDNAVDCAHQRAQNFYKNDRRSIVPKHTISESSPASAIFPGICISQNTFP